MYHVASPALGHSGCNRTLQPSPSGQGAGASPSCAPTALPAATGGLPTCLPCVWVLSQYAASPGELSEQGAQLPSDCGRAFRDAWGFTLETRGTGLIPVLGYIDKNFQSQYRFVCLKLSCLDLYAPHEREGWTLKLCQYRESLVLRRHALTSHT